MDYELTKESSRSVVFSEDDKRIIVRSERLLSTHSGHPNHFGKIIMHTVFVVQHVREFDEGVKWR